MAKQKSKRSKSSDDKKASDEPSANPPKEKKSRLVLLLCCCAVLLVVVWFTGVPAKSCLSFASNAILDNRLTEAESWISRAEMLGGETPDTHFARTRVYNWRGRGQQANEALAKVKKLGPENPDVREYEELLATKLGDMTAAKRLIDRRETQWPRDAYEAYVRCAFQTDRHGWAEQTLEGWADVFPDDAYPDYLRGRMRELQDRPQQALTAYEQAIAKQPHLTVAECRRAFVLRSQRQYEEAQAAFARAQRTHLDVVGRLEAAACLEKLGKYDAAWELVEPTLTIPLNEVLPQYTEAEELMEDDRASVIAGRIRASQEQDEQAVEYLQDALDYNPRNTDVRGRFAASLRRLKRTSEADQQVAIQKQQTNYQAAARQLQVVLDQQPANHNARVRFAQLLFQSDSLATAEYHVQVVLTMDPKNETAKELAVAMKQERQRQKKLAKK